MDYEITWGGDPEDLLVATSGDASVEDLNAWLSSVVSDPRFRAGLKILIDHRRTRWSALSDADIRRRAAQVTGDGDRIGHQRVAAVVSSPVDTGLGLMFRRMLEGRVDVELEVFNSSSLESARAWLAEESRGDRT